MKTCVQYRALIDAIENIFYCFFFFIIILGSKVWYIFSTNTCFVFAFIFGSKIRCTFSTNIKCVGPSLLCHF